MTKKDGIAHITIECMPCGEKREIDVQVEHTDIKAQYATEYVKRGSYKFSAIAYVDGHYEIPNGWTKVPGGYICPECK